jgi:hypothetical protein
MHIGAASAPFVYVIERNHQSLASDQHLEPCHRIQPPRYQTLGYVYKTLAPTAPMHTPAISGVPSPPVRTPPCPLSHEDVVEMMGQLSNHNRYLRLTQLHTTVLGLCSSDSTQPKSSYHAPRRSQHRLSPEQVLDLMTAYRSGVAVNALAERFSVHRSTVLDHLNLADTPRRYPSLSDYQVEEAARLYRAGQSLRELGLRYGVHASTVRSAFIRNNVVMRDQHGWER